MPFIYLRYIFPYISISAWLFLTWMFSIAWADGLIPWVTGIAFFGNVVLFIPVKLYLDYKKVVELVKAELSELDELAGSFDPDGLTGYYHRRCEHAVETIHSLGVPEFLVKRGMDKAIALIKPNLK